MCSREADADLEQPESEAAHAHYVWQYFSVINQSEAKKAGPRMLVAGLVTIFSVVAALPEQLHISWRVLSWANIKQEYKHVLQSTKRMMTGVEC